MALQTDIGQLQNRINTITSLSKTDAYSTLASAQKMLNLADQIAGDAGQTTRLNLETLLMSHSIDIDQGPDPVDKITLDELKSDAIRSVIELNAAYEAAGTQEQAVDDLFSELTGNIIHLDRTIYNAGEAVSEGATAVATKVAEGGKTVIVYLVLVLVAGAALLYMVKK